MLDKFFKTSWKTTCLGMAYFLWEVFHEVCASMDGQPISKRNVGKACFVAVMGLVARDWNKSSEDEGLKPDGVTMDRVQGMITAMLFGGVKPDSNRSGPTGGASLILACVLMGGLCPARSAFAMLDVKPEVKPGAVEIHDNGNVTLPAKAVNVEAPLTITGTAQPDTFKAQVGSSNGPLVNATGTVNVSPNVPLISFLMPKDAAWAQFSVQPNGFHLEKDAFNVRLLDEPAAKALGE